MNHDSRGRSAHPGTFSQWFLEQEIRADADMGVAADRAQLHLCRAVAFLEQGMFREALTEANLAAHHDPALREQALVVARMCVRRELEDELRAS
jgi:hypothetical protein